MDGSDNMAIINDKQVAVCICGKSNNKILRTSKQRALTIIGSLVLAGFTIALLIDPSFILEKPDIKSVILYGLILYFIVIVPYKLVSFKKLGHSFFCSPRRAYLEIV